MTLGSAMAAVLMLTLSVAVAQQGVDVVHGAHPPPTVSGMNTVLALPRHELHGGTSSLLGGRDVEEGEFVHPLLAIAASHPHRIARIDADR